VERAGMEATSDYWKPVYFLLEREGFDCLLYQASQVKAGTYTSRAIRGPYPDLGCLPSPAAPSWIRCSPPNRSAAIAAGGGMQGTYPDDSGT